MLLPGENQEIVDIRVVTGYYAYQLATPVLVSQQPGNRSSIDGNQYHLPLPPCVILNQQIRSNLWLKLNLSFLILKYERVDWVYFSLIHPFVMHNTTHFCAGSSANGPVAMWSKGCHMCRRRATELNQLSTVSRPRAVRTSNGSMDNPIRECINTQCWPMAITGIYCTYMIIALACTHCTWICQFHYFS